ncbi:MAG: TolC family protein [Candidatus Eisenbacteria bacterium]
MKRTACMMAIAALISPGPAPPAEAIENGGPLTLGKALELAIERSPELGALRLEEEAGEARAFQEGRRPNPEFGVEWENFGGTGTLGGFDSRETTVLLGQTFELGGKRGRRVRVAEIGREFASLSRREGTLALVREVKVRFADLVAAEERARLAGDRLLLAEELREVVAKRLEAGSGSPAEEGNGRVALEAGRIERDRASMERERAGRALAALWGDGEFGFGGALPSGSEGEIPEWARIAPLAAAGPSVGRASLETRLRSAEVDVARAGRIPDLRLGGGVRSYSGDGEWAWVAEAAIPLPLFDRGEGRREEAKARAAAAEERERTARTRALSEARDLHDRLVGLRSERLALEERLIPEAEQALETTRRAFEQGRLPMREVLEARSALFETIARVIETRAETSRTLAALEYVLGVSFAEMNAGEEEER